MEALAGKEKVVGLKQVRRAVTAGRVRKVFLACDADPRLIQPLRELCSQEGTEADDTLTMQQLGRACGIDVPAAAVALLRAD